MIRKALLIAGLSLTVSACIGEEKDADLWPRSGDVIYAAEMHVYCDGSRDLRFIGPFRDMEQGKAAASNLREDSLETGGGAEEYNVNFWMVRRYVQGASGNPRIERAKRESLDCV